MAARRAKKKGAGKAKRKAGAWTDAELVRAAIDLHARLELFFHHVQSLAGIDPNDPDKAVSDEELVKLYRPEQFIPSPPEAIRIAREWLERSEAERRADLASVLMTLAVNVACELPGADLTWTLERAASLRPDGRAAKLKAVRDAISKPSRQSDIGRAFKVFNLLAEGAPCDPGPQVHRAPRGALKSQLEAKIAMVRPSPH